MGAGGLEPPHPKALDLNLVRLPIPPRSLIINKNECINIQIIEIKINLGQLKPTQNLHLSNIYQLLNEHHLF